MLAAVFGLVLLADAAVEARFSVKMVESEAKATFMIIAGITSGAEMCLTAEGGLLRVFFFIWSVEVWE